MTGYVLAAFAGIALGIALITAWQAWRNRSSATDRPAPAAPGDPSGGIEPGAKQQWHKLRSPRIALGAVALGALAVVAVAVLRPAPADVAGPGGTPDGGKAASLDDVDTMIKRLEARLRENPSDGEGFRMLGWSYMMTGRAQQALEPFRKSLALLPQQANVHAGYGEALVSVAAGTVTDEAKAEFDKALALDPAEPRARYFAALFQSQYGDEKGALDNWIALANSGAPDAPWQAEVRGKIAEVSGKLGIDVAGRLKAGSAPSAALPPPAGPADIRDLSARFVESDREAMIARMVDGLAERLKTNPDDVDGWSKLLRSRMVLQQGDQAARDLVTARAALARDPAKLARIEGEARDLGVPGAR